MTLPSRWERKENLECGFNCIKKSWLGNCTKDSFSYKKERMAFMIMLTSLNSFVEEILAW